jgi:hypothetical protein
MNPTSKLAHFKNGGNSVLGLPVWLDDENSEFVSHQGKWVHVDDMPLEKLHTVDTSIAVSPKRIPVFTAQPQVPNISAFKEAVHQTNPNPQFIFKDGELVKQ